ncbi:50S ribosomal protein L25 [Halobacteriovorax sp. GFR7]|uniref:50S ribosomal protein L25 n=1 Tax=unclassified Halobacteriovorax TaxID=2639665 RepID=UPI003721F948
MSTTSILKVETRKPGRSTTQMRKDGYIPGTIYGKGFAGAQFMVPKQGLSKFLHTSGKVFEVEFEGKKHLVTLADVQRGHLGTDFVHCSFHKVSAKDKVVISLPIHFVGEAVGTKAGGLINFNMHEVEVEGLPKDMPESLEFDITGLELDGHWSLEHFTLPTGLTWAHEPTASVVSCHLPKVVVEPEVEETEMVVETHADAEAAEKKEEAAS